MHVRIITPIDMLTCLLSCKRNKEFQFYSFFWIYVFGYFQAFFKIESSTITHFKTINVSPVSWEGDFLFQSSLFELCYSLQFKLSEFYIMVHFSSCFLSLSVKDVLICNENKKIRLQIKMQITRNNIETPNLFWEI